MTSALERAVRALDVRAHAGGVWQMPSGRAVNLVRINLSPGDGWRCLRCGWNVYDPTQDAALPVDDQRAIANADGPTR